MKRTIFAIVAVLLSVATGMAQPLPAAGAKATLADLAWISGRWVDDSDGNLSEEIWTAPAGDSMLGMWRYVMGGKTGIFELLAIKAAADGPVLWIRHFSPQFVAREEKDQPVALKLVEWKNREARFTGPAVGAPGMVTITYRRPADDTLAVTLEKEGKKEEFSFRRKP